MRVCVLVGRRRHSKHAKVIDLRRAQVQNEIHFSAGRFIFRISVLDDKDRETAIEFAHTLGEDVAAWLADIVFLSQRLTGVTPWEPVQYNDFISGDNSPYTSYTEALQKIRGSRNAVPSIQRRALIEGIRQYVAVRTSWEAAFTRYCSEVVLRNEYDRTQAQAPQVRPLTPNTAFIPCFCCCCGLKCAVV